MFSLFGDMLCQLSKEIQCTEDLEIALWPVSQIVTGSSRKTPTFVFLRSINDRASFSEPDNAGQTEGTAKDVLRQALEAERVARREVCAVVDAKSRVLPGPHFVDRLLIDLFRRMQHRENLGLPNLAQTDRVDTWQTDECPIRRKAAISCNCMTVSW